MFEFDPTQNLIKVEVEISNGDACCNLVCALDTRTARTIFPVEILSMLGYSVDDGEITRIITAQGTDGARSTRLDRVRSLGLSVREMPVLAYDIPKELQVHGLLGKDFFAGTRLHIDFANGYVWGKTDA